MGMGYPSNHYISHNSSYYPPDASNVLPANANSSSSNVYRERYPSGSDWNRDRDFEYRRDYERRNIQPPST